MDLGSGARERTVISAPAIGAVTPIWYESIQMSGLQRLQ
jgi:hypothetical protein